MIPRARASHVLALMGATHRSGEDKLLSDGGAPGKSPARPKNCRVKSAADAEGTNAAVGRRAPQSQAARSVQAIALVTIPSIKRVNPVAKKARLRAPAGENASALARATSNVA